jgi:two-component system cell cycle sensor histidine kinase PleC
VLFEALEMLRQRAADQDITMKTDIDETLAPVCCDRRRIVEVLFNLLDNALKYTPRQGQIAIRLYRDGDNARVDIIDSGIGISSEDLARLFQPFERLEPVSLSRQYEGTGLGLALSKQLVELHGGAIGVQSAGEGRGSTFWFTLPR